MLLNWLAITSHAATISIAAVDAVESPAYDLTSIHGTVDWAYWDQTTTFFSPVPPGNEKSGANLIGSISAFNGGDVRGSVSSNKPVYDFTFTDGTSPTSGTVSDLIGLFNTTLGPTGLEKGVQVDVTAPTAEPFTIYAWGTAFAATGTLTATIGTASDTNASLTLPMRVPGKMYTSSVVPDFVGQAVNLRMVMTASTGSTSNVSLSAVAVAVPEPSTLALAGFGVAGLVFRGLRLIRRSSGTGVDFA